MKQKKSPTLTETGLKESENIPLPGIGLFSSKGKVEVQLTPFYCLMVNDFYIKDDLRRALRDIQCDVNIKMINI